MTPQQAASVKDFLTENGLADSWYRPGIEATDYVTAHPDPTQWTNHDYEVLDHLATRNA